MTKIECYRLLTLAINFTLIARGNFVGKMKNDKAYAIYCKVEIVRTLSSFFVFFLEIYI